MLWLLIRSTSLMGTHDIYFQEEVRKTAGSPCFWATMVWCFTPLSTLFKSYWDDRRLIMKGFVQWSIIQSWAEFCVQRDSNLRSHDTKSEALTKQPPGHFSSEMYWYMSLKTYAVGTHQTCLREMLLMRTNNICFQEEIRKIAGSPLIWTIRKYGECPKILTVNQCIPCFCQCREGSNQFSKVR